MAGFRGAWDPVKGVAVWVDGVETRRVTPREAIGAATDPPKELSIGRQVRATSDPLSTRDLVPARAGLSDRVSSSFSGRSQGHHRTGTRKYQGNRGGFAKYLQALTYRETAALDRDFRRLVRD
jgi:hypothetical protein